MITVHISSVSSWLAPHFKALMTQKISKIRKSHHHDKVADYNGELRFPLLVKKSVLSYSSSCRSACVCRQVCWCVVSRRSICGNRSSSVRIHRTFCLTRWSTSTRSTSCWERRPSTWHCRSLTSWSTGRRRALQAASRVAVSTCATTHRDSPVCNLHNSLFSCCLN